MSLLIALTCSSCRKGETNDVEPSAENTVISTNQNPEMLKEYNDSDSSTHGQTYSLGANANEPKFSDYSDDSADFDESEIESINQAKQEVIDAQSDLNRSVKSLSDGDWENDLPTVQRRLRALEDANSNLNDLDSSAAADMDWEIQRMKRDVRRIEDENWRDVVPDIESRNRALNWESDNIESSISE
jgi:hypothetical protein